MEMATGAGVAVAARLRVPEQRFAQNDGCLGITNIVDKPGHWGHTHGFEREHHRQTVGTQLSRHARLVAAVAVDTARQQCDRLATLRNGALLPGNDERNAANAGNAVARRATHGCEAIDQIAWQSCGGLIWREQIEIVQRARGTPSCASAAVA